MNFACKKVTNRLSSLLILTILSGVLSTPSRGDEFDPCQGLQPTAGIGSSTQAPAHLSVFIPSYSAICSASGITYQGVGDSAGVNGALAHDARYTFYASDLPLTAVEKQLVERDTSSLRFRFASSINQIPMLVDGFAVTYNLGSCQTVGSLRISAFNLSLIYSGVITRWNDQRILNDNPASPGLATCSLSIRPAIRSDVAGPTAIFKDYLAKVNPLWTPYTNKDLNSTWPSTLAINCRGTGENGMASCMGDPGAVGYVEFKVANSKGLKMALINNSSGEFLAPATDVINKNFPDNCTAAAESASVPPSTLSDWSQTSLTYPPRGYGLCSFTYVFLFQQIGYAYTNAVSDGRRINTTNYLMNALKDPVQEQLASFGFAPLPESIRVLGRQGIILSST